MSLPRLVLAVICLLALAPAPARADGGSFTYMLCANPDTGRGTTPHDGMFPDGVTMSTTHPSMSTLQGAQKCSGYMAHDRGLWIKTNGSYTLPQSGGTTFMLRVPDQLRFVGAHLFRRVNATNGMMTAFTRSADDWMYASPNWDRCENPGWVCTVKGDHLPFIGANYVHIGQAHDRLSNGLKWFLRCAGHGCNVNDHNAFKVFGGKVLLEDERGPGGSLGVGGLGADGVLRGVEEVAFHAADGESGVYRARVLVDGASRGWFAVDGGASACRDANFANGDDYEFDLMRPCPSSANGVASLDTSTVSDGRHNLRLEVEDASGRVVRLMDRDVTFDNIDPPTAVADPEVAGWAKDGYELTFSDAEWDFHGAPSAATVTSRWERCSADGTECVPAGTSASVVLDEGDVGKRFRVVSTAVNDEGSGVAVSALSSVVLDTPAPSSVSGPSVAGAPRRGNLLVASPASWDDHGAVGEPAIGRQWQRCTAAACVDIAAATGPTYELVDADLARRIVLVESASNGEGVGRVSSAPTARVTREDGTLPADNNGEDDDGDGEVDEPGETAGGSGSGSGSGSGGGGGGGVGGNGAGATPVPAGKPGAAGAVGAAGASGGAGSAGSSSTSSSSRSTTVVVARNGEGASAHARLTVGFRDARGTVMTVDYGRRPVVAGRLVDETGRPIARAAVEVAAVPSLRGARPVGLPAVITSPDGRFVWKAPRGVASSTVRFSYAYERGGAPVVRDELSLRVRSGVRLSVRLRGAIASYSGVVLSRPLPAAGKLVILQGRARGTGAPWQTFASRRASRNGTFKGRYRLKVRRPGRKLQFRARVVAESGYPYLTGSSRAVTRVVR